ncbi:hypothetical protein [Streptomyces sp. SID13031]|uniref:hypothetical protein n=1 Tax=Streptomyces sp. SID13031 TaxID=2706046 RepID=UPI0013C6AF0F|nr:hypothetical protein [Streptomyces sp. SID13031]NEA32685.1 hypothetical protein [Streptomyces sp. SID13031]
MSIGSQKDLDLTERAGLAGEATSQEVVAGAAGDTADAEEHVGNLGLVFGVGFWIALGLAFALGNDQSRAWINHNLAWVVGTSVVLIVIAAVVILTDWVKDRDTTARAAVLVLISLPVLALLTAGALFMLPAPWQLIATRSVMLVVLITTPAAMWWLFLAQQRASLLNEFLTNLQRLGLLETQRVETAEARSTRVGSYLQKFEAAYGRLPTGVHEDVQKRRFEQYSPEDMVRAKAPLASSAVPIFMLIVVLAIGWLITLPPLHDFPRSSVEPRWLLTLAPNVTPVTVAFLGAYFFSLQMLFRRYVRTDLRGSAYVAVLMRILLAVIGIWVIEAVASELGWSGSELLIVGFVVGVFPVVVWQVIRNVAMKLFKFALPTLDSTLALDRIDGLTVWHQSRLEEEDIENVPNMATADIVDLLVNTRIPAGRVVDWVDQSILLTQLGAEDVNSDESNSTRRQLSRHGIRTASTLLKTADDKRTVAEIAAFQEMAKDGTGQSVVPSLISAVQTSSNLALILRWRGLDCPNPIDTWRQRMV